jgi:hypothetical protein
LHRRGVAIDDQFDIAAREVESFEDPVNLFLHKVGLSTHSLRAALPYAPRGRGRAAQRVTILCQVVTNRSCDVLDRNRCRGIE